MRGCQWGRGTHPGTPYIQGYIMSAASYMHMYKKYVLGIWIKIDPLAAICTIGRGLHNGS